MWGPLCGPFQPLDCRVGNGPHSGPYGCYSAVMPFDATRSIELSCYAKVNLALSVGALQSDGYHPLASWMVALTFADALTLARSAEGSSTFDITFADDAPLRQPVDWPLEKDLGFRAHALLEKHTGRELPVALSLRKRIPAGAGLGGGSSDAAGVLVAMNRLFGLGFDVPTLRALAATLGADVAFLVAAHDGMPSALATGRGEVLEPILLREVIHLVLIFPPFGCPTGEVYGAFDRMSSGAQPDVDAVRALA